MQKMIIKRLEITFITLILSATLSISTAAAPSVVPNKNSATKVAERALLCSQVLKSLPPLTAGDVRDFGRTYTKSQKNEFEKQAAYELRIKQEYEKHQNASAAKAQGIKGYRLIVPQVSQSYNAELERFELYNLIQVGDFNTGLAKKRFFALTTSTEYSHNRSLNFGAKIESYSYYGFALIENVKDKALGERTIIAKMPISIAKTLKDKIGIAVAAKPAPPWVVDKFETETDWGSLVQKNRTETAIAAEIICVAVVNTDTLEVIRLIK